jgi:hypothetical protein
MTATWFATLIIHKKNNNRKMIRIKEIELNYFMGELERAMSDKDAFWIERMKHSVDECQYTLFILKNDNYTEGFYNLGIRYDFSEDIDLELARSVCYW